LAIAAKNITYTAVTLLDFIMKNEGVNASNIHETPCEIVKITHDI